MHSKTKKLNKTSRFLSSLFSKRTARLFIFVLLFGIYSVTATLLLGHACPINLIFGVPCPGCGLTRAVLLFLRGDFAGAFAMHPLFVVLPLAAALCFAAFLCPRFERSRVFIALCALIVAAFIGVYIYRMVTLFPAQEPLAYNRRSLLFILIDLFKKIFA